MTYHAIQSVCLALNSSPNFVLLHCPFPLIKYVNIIWYFHVDTCHCVLLLCHKYCNTAVLCLWLVLTANRINNNFTVSAHVAFLPVVRFVVSPENAPFYLKNNQSLADLKDCCETLKHKINNYFVMISSSLIHCLLQLPSL